MKTSKADKSEMVDAPTNPQQSGDGAEARAGEHQNQKKLNAKKVVPAANREFKTPAAQSGAKKRVQKAEKSWQWQSKSDADDRLHEPNACNPDTQFCRIHS